MSKDSILVDLYNLELKEIPDSINGIDPDSQDRDLILAFLGEYAPTVARYITDAVFDYTNPYMDGSEKRTFEQIKGKSYFQSDEVINFYNFYNLARNLVETNISHTETPTREPEQAVGLLSDIKHTLLLTNSEGERLIIRDYNRVGSIPEKIDLSQYSIQYKLDDSGEYLFGGTRIYLTLAGLKYRLFNAIIEMWNGKIVIKKCVADGCNKLFIAYKSGRLEQIYCSKTCKMREYRKRKQLLPIK